MSSDKTPFFDPRNVKFVSQNLFYDFYNSDFRKVFGVTNFTIEFFEATEILIFDFIGEVIECKCPQSLMSRTDSQIQFKFDFSTVYTTVQFTFLANISEQPTGFFHFKDDVYSSIFAQAEPFGIIQMMPCINFPKIKPRINLFVITRSYEQCFANQPIKQTWSEIANSELDSLFFRSHFDFSNLKNYRLYSFELLEKTPVHLFSLCVGSFLAEHTTIYLSGNLPEFTRKVQLSFVLNRGSIPLRGEGVKEIFFETAEFAIRNTQDFFQVRFPYDKIDFAFVRFCFGAMENPGLITVNIPSLESIRMNTFAHFNRQRMIIHEICHTYFGNMLSIETFDDVWFKEAITEYLSAKLHSKFHRMKSDGSDGQLELYRQFDFVKYVSMFSDLVSNPHAICSNPQKPSNFYSDTIYYKGMKAFKILDSLLENNIIDDFLVKLVQTRVFGTLSSSELFALFRDFLVEKQAIVLETLSFKNEDLKESKSCFDLIDRLIDYLFRSVDYSIIRVGCNFSKDVLIVENLKELTVPLYLEIKHFDKNFKEKETLKRIFDLKKDIEIKGFKNKFEKDDFILVDNEHSGLLICVYDTAIMDRLLHEQMITKLGNSYMRYSLFHAVEIMKKEQPENDTYSSYAVKKEFLKTLETSPVFEYFSKRI